MTVNTNKNMNKFQDRENYSIGYRYYLGYKINHIPHYSATDTLNILQ